jgi:hypothetical protein
MYMGKIEEGQMLEFDFETLCPMFASFKGLWVISAASLLDF